MKLFITINIHATEWMISFLPPCCCILRTAYPSIYPAIHPCVYHGSHPECPVGAQWCRKLNCCRPVISQTLECSGVKVALRADERCVSAFLRRDALTANMWTSICSPFLLTSPCTHKHIRIYSSCCHRIFWSVAILSISRWANFRWLFVLFALYLASEEMPWKPPRHRNYFNKF